MPNTDPIDFTSHIFTEADVYMICAFLAGNWEVSGIPPGETGELSDSIEDAIMKVLRLNLDLGRAA